MVGYQVHYRRFSLLYLVACFGDVYRVSLDPVAVLVAVMAVGVVGRLYGFGADFLVFERQYGFVPTYLPCIASRRQS